MVIFMGQSAFNSKGFMGLEKIKDIQWYRHTEVKLEE